MTRGRAEGLTDRRSERQVLDRLVEAARADESRTLVVHGDPGAGKTVLLAVVSWLGVTMYLTLTAISATLATLA
jgi:hypothetical protein